MTNRKIYKGLLRTGFLSVGILFILLIGNANASLKDGSIYYIDAHAGNDLHSGLAVEEAWKSFTHIESLSLQPGDQLLLKRGSVFHELLRISGEGKQGKLITIDAYGEGEKPQIHAPDASLYAVLIRNSSYLTMRNLEIVNTGSQALAGRTGLKVESIDYGVSQNIHLFALDIRDVNGSRVKSEGGGSGMLIESRGALIPSKFDQLVIEHCTIKRCERNGMIWSANWDRRRWYPSTNVQVRYNSIEEVPGDGIVPIGCDGAIIEYNKMSKSPASLPATEAAAGIWPWSCDNTLIQFNEVSDHKAPWDAQGFDADYNSRNTVIQYNYSHDNEGGFVLICNSGESDSLRTIGNTGTLVQYNLSLDDGVRTRKTRVGMFSPLIHLAGPVQGTLVMRNFLLAGDKHFDGADRSMVTSDSWAGFSDQTTFKENFFIATEKSSFRLTSSTNNRFEGNYYHGAFEGLPPDGDGKPRLVATQQAYVNYRQRAINLLSKKEIGDGKDVLLYIDPAKIQQLFMILSAEKAH